MSADVFRRYLDIVSEQAKPWGDTPAAPDVTGMQPGQDRDLGGGSRVRLKPDGTIEYSGSWGTHRYNSAGQHIGYQSPSFSGHQVSFDAQGRKTQTYSAGPLRTKTGPEGSEVSYDTGLARFNARQDAAGKVLDQNVQMREQDKKPAPPKVRRLSDISDEEMRQWLTPDPAPAGASKKPAPVREADITPAQFPRRGLNRQQRQAPQMPAEFKPKKISVLKNRTDPQHPAKGYFVGDSREDHREPVEEADALKPAGTYGTLNMEGYNTSWLEKLVRGNKPVRGITPAQALAELRLRMNSADPDYQPSAEFARRYLQGSVKESQTTEDMISAVRRGIDHYLRDLEQKMDPDRGLVDKAKSAIRRDPLDQLLPVKTVRTHDGRSIKIVGNERDGFQVRIGEQLGKSRFHSLEEAEMACEMYCNRRRRAEREHLAQDYVDETE